MATRKQNKKPTTQETGAFGYPVEKKDEGTSLFGRKFAGLEMREDDAFRGRMELDHAEAAEFSSRNAEIFGWSGLDPAQFGYMRRNFEKGDFRSCVPTFEKIMENDDRLLAVSQKRYESVSSLDYEIQLMDGVAEDDPEALAQQDVIRDFFNTLTCSSVMKRDMRQGLSALISHLMQAICFGYAAATLELRPAWTQSGLPTVHGKTTCVPLRFFEAKQRLLKLRLDYYDTDGEWLDQYAWVICANPKTPLIIASCVLFILKSTPLEDWASVVEKFGKPFIYAKTTAKKGDRSWQDLMRAVKRIGSNFTGVFGKEIEIVAQSVAQGNAPHEKLIECLNRAIAILWRGGDVSTESKAGTDTVGGVALQGAEKEARTKSDRILIEETLDVLTRRVIETVFGYDVPQKVYFKFATDNTAEINSNIAKLKVAKEIGLPVSTKWTYSALNVPPPAEDDTTLDYASDQSNLQDAPQSDENAPKTPFMNAGGANGKVEANDLSLSDLDVLHEAQNEEWKELLTALQILQTVPESEFPAALRAFAKNFPAIAGKIQNRNTIASTMSQIVEDALRDMAQDTENA